MVFNFYTNKFSSFKGKIFLFAFLGFFISVSQTNAAVKNSLSTGSWSNPAIWSPAGVPTANDNVVIQSNHIVTIDNTSETNSLTVYSNGELKFVAAKILTIHNALTVNGKMAMNGGDINFVSTSAFNLGSNSTFTWEPSNNTSAGATLFTNGTEHFDATSTLIIKKWYDYSSVPLGSVVSGDFGNVTLNTLSNGFLFEWNQNNQFETHKILGTLTIEQGWIVLDKSGSISNTTIGKINLATPNAYLDFHNGTHNSSFAINTSGISNTGGSLNGIYNGNGNITLNITGNFTNLGNVVLIYNTGVFGVGNGNANMNVSGDYNQSSGDFRAIFNLTTLNAGASNLNFNNLHFTGGIMMGHYACHTSSATCNFKVNGNLEINSTNATDKFRVVGLTSLTGTFNNLKSNLIVNGNLLLSGNAAAEFTSSGSVGAETISIGGSTIVNGGVNNFNMGSHQITFNNTGDLTISGGNLSLSKTPGTATVTVGGNINQTSGAISLKGNTGTADVTVSGNFSLSNGTYILHDNMGIASPNPVNLTVNGNFSHTGGTINFDNNSSSSSVNALYLKGSQYIIGGNGIITHADAGTGQVFGMLNFSRSGIISFQRISSSHSIQQVKQQINNGCTVDVISGNLQVSSHSTPAVDYLKILSGGVLKMNDAKIISNTLAANSGITVDNNGRLSLKHTNGLYNGTDNACISSNGNMNYYLAPNSIVEYNGTDSQLLTGTGTGLATTNNHKYGILEINFQGTPDAENVYLASSTVFVRTALTLTKGELKLNSNPVTIESGNSLAVSRVAGYVKSESIAANNSSMIKWMNMGSGVHVFPFGVSSIEYIPFSFTPVSGMGGSVSIATRATGVDNLPFPSGGNIPSVTNLNRDGTNISISSVIDRWFDITAPGFKANLTASYRGIENTTSDSLSDASFSLQAWDGNKWSPSMGSGTAVRNGTGTISANNVSLFNHLIISATASNANSNDFLEFTALLIQKEVNLSWSVNPGSSINYFSVERSVDQINFTEVGKVTAAPVTGEVHQYSYTDVSPLKGTTYYRLKQINSDSKIFYSNTEIIIYNESKMQDFSIISIFPNPFKDHLTISFMSSGENATDLVITGSNGQIVRTEQINTVEGKNTYEYFEKQNLPQGVYVITLKNGGNIVSKKLFKS